MNSDPDICCYPFDKSVWDEKTHEWSDKLFLQDQVMQLLHIPLNMSQLVSKMHKKIEAAEAMPETKDFLMLIHDTSPWKSEIYMTVTKNVRDGVMAKLSGRFVSKVYDGPYQDVPKWIADMASYVRSHKQKALKYYLHFAYCPKCAKKYEHNYCVVFAQVES